MLFLGRPRRLFGGTSVSTSAAPMLASRDLDLGAFLSGVLLRLVLALPPTWTSDFLGRPRGRLMGDGASGSLSGIVVVFVRVTRLIDGDCAFSSSVPGSA